MDIINQVNGFLGNNSGVILTVLGIIWGIAKGFSNDKAGAIVGSIQAAVDKVANIVLAVGGILQKVSQILSDVIKSDGILGKK